MANVELSNIDDTAISQALPVIASLAPTNPTDSGAPAIDPTTTADYYYAFPEVEVGGSGFTYDSLGRLSGGTITAISMYHPIVDNGLGANGGAGVIITNTSVPVPILLNLFGTGQSVLPALLAGSNTFTTQSSTVTGSDGNDYFHVLGASTNYDPGVFYGEPSVDHTLVNLNGGGGQNTADFGLNLRNAATLVGGGNDESVLLAGIMADLVAIDTLQFLDGSVYESNASAGAQAALMFEGIFGRFPDAINAGGFALVAQQGGTVAAAAQMLATPEGNGDTTELGNAAFVTRLYQNMLHRAPEAAGLAGWQGDLDSGRLSRADVSARFASSNEAQSVNATAFATGSVFAADPNAVEVLRAFETLLTRVPEAASLTKYANQLDSGMTLQQFYTEVQDSAEFAARGPNPYGITTATPYATVSAIAHADPINALIAPLVTNQGVAHQ